MLIEVLQSISEAQFQIPGMENLTQCSKVSNQLWPREGVLIFSATVAMVQSPLSAGEERVGWLHRGLPLALLYLATVILLEVSLL